VVIIGGQSASTAAAAAAAAVSFIFTAHDDDGLLGEGLCTDDAARDALGHSTFVLEG
jgi:hypothetical protein